MRRAGNCETATTPTRRPGPRHLDLADQAVAEARLRHAIALMRIDITKPTT
jgi:hypothetical protein